MYRRPLGVAWPREPLRLDRARARRAARDRGVLPRTADRRAVARRNRRRGAARRAARALLPVRREHLSLRDALCPRRRGLLRDRARGRRQLPRLEDALIDAAQAAARRRLGRRPPHRSGDGPRGRLGARHRRPPHPRPDEPPPQRPALDDRSPAQRAAAAVDRPARARAHRPAARDRRPARHRPAAEPGRPEPARCPRGGAERRKGARKRLRARDRGDAAGSRDAGSS